MPAKRKHGHAGIASSKIPRSPTYNTWALMKHRCHNPNADAYSRYGGVGIVVCERWHTFQNFLDDMGVRPEGLTLDRIDPYGNYEPGNCRWATKLEQRHNRRDDKKGKA